MINRTMIKKGKVYLEVLSVEEDEAKEGPGHGPLVTAVLEHDDVQHLQQQL